VIAGFSAALGPIPDKPLQFYPELASRLPDRRQNRRVRKKRAGFARLWFSK
jgi:hypothetical protein